MDMASSFIKHVLASSTIRQAKDGTIDSSPETDSNDGERKQKLLGKSVVQPSITVTKSEVESILAKSTRRMERTWNVSLRTFWKFWHV